ncbi:MAG: 3'-5' exonuclease [Prevotella sp.]|nr:3'-5' exonuclease [Prevotella sp.]
MELQSILDGLNERQREAVVYIDGPQQVIAGAGSGKTRVLTYKIAYLLQQGYQPWNILALTFTNKAAKEMQARIATVVGEKLANRLYMGTFHSIFARVLRVEAQHIGFTSNFTIYDETDSRSLIKSIVKEMGLDDKVYKPSAVHNRISMAKNHLITAAQYRENQDYLQQDQRSRMPSVHKIYTTYTQRCRTANVMDFDDLLILTYQLFSTNEEVRRYYANRFQYVLVDEYQDTNRVQQAIVTLLTQERQRICVVGDDAQSIYGFRGANIDNILDFQQIYPNTLLYKLEQNYRSTQTIVKVANSLIKNNKRQIPKDVYSENEPGDKLVIKQLYSDREEATMVCKDIRRIKIDEGGEYGDFAILYRTNSQSRTFEEEMRKQGIPYKIYGGLSFYQRKEIKDVIAYFRLVNNTNDEEAFKRILNYPTRGIGQTTLSKLSVAAQQYEVSFWDVISQPDLYPCGLSKATYTKIGQFKALIEGFVAQMDSVDAAALGRKIIMESGIHRDLYSSTDAEDLVRQENLDELLSGLQDFVETRREEGRLDEMLLSDYLQEVALVTDVESEDEEESRVLLMTVHAAKGLEFPYVFVVGMEENIFPSQRSCESMRELEEERRLLYVAITRAEKKCILTSAKNRYRYGRMEFGTPSRFLCELDPALVKMEATACDDDSYSRSSYGRFSSDRSASGHGSDDYRRSGRYSESSSDCYQNSRPVADRFMADPIPKLTKPGQSEKAVDPFSYSFKQRLAAAGANMKRVDAVIGHSNDNASTASSDASAFGVKEGYKIEHQRFGMGTVVKLEGTGENTKATVKFENTGTKQLLLKFARFKVLD